MSVSEEPGKPTQARCSSRERILTEKGQELHVQEAMKHEKEFYKAYDSWKQLAQETRTKLKLFCLQEVLIEIQQDIQCRHGRVCQHYESLIRHRHATPEIVKRMDACTTLTTEICELVSKRLETIDLTFNDRLEKERIRMALNKDEYGSVFGYTNTESSLQSDVRSRASSKVSRKLVDAEVDLATKLEQAKAMQKIQNQEAILRQLESEWKLKEARLQAEFQLKLQEEKTKLQQLHTDKEVQIAAARVKAYSSLQTDFDCYEEEDDPFGYIPEHKPLFNPEAVDFHPQPTSSHLPSAEVSSLAQALASALAINRLSPPELTTFTGDPLKFIDWKISFTALIDQRPIPACEKMLYLKRYLAGEAHKAVEGHFYRNSEEAYKSAWTVLQERYGNPFIVQKSFRDKLTKWPKLSANDPLALREFADFLHSCLEAIPHVKGLAILNDCEENHKLLKKLPEWIVHRWSRVVTKEMDASGDYPSFAQFTEFMQMEARIACNPIASPLMMNLKPTEEGSTKRASVFNTSIELKNSTPKGTDRVDPNVKLPCFICMNEEHSLAVCPIFAEKTTEDKKTFIFENHICFGCLKRGHISKNCKERHICSTCGRRHPTCLHQEKSELPMDAKEDSALTEGYTVQKVTSHVLTQHSTVTSSIVPVFVSSAEMPYKEILTYALLDTQSDSTFILQDLASELNINVQPVQLKLSTMTAVDKVIASKSVRNLLIRGLYSRNCIQLQQAYTHDFIPVDKSYIPTNQTALQWHHLRHLSDKLPSLQSCEVGMVIGCNCPSALAPLEVITGCENEPFAQRTKLGWSIIGSSNHHLECQGSQSFAHRIVVKEVSLPSTSDTRNPKGSSEDSSDDSDSEENAKKAPAQQKTTPQVVKAMNVKPLPPKKVKYSSFDSSSSEDETPKRKQLPVTKSPVAAKTTAVAKPAAKARKSDSNSNEEPEGSTPAKTAAIKTQSAKSPAAAKPPARQLAKGRDVSSNDSLDNDEEEPLAKGGKTAPSKSPAQPAKPAVNKAKESSSYTDSSGGNEKAATRPAAKVTSAKAVAAKADSSSDSSNSEEENKVGGPAGKRISVPVKRATSGSERPLNNVIPMNLDVSSLKGSVNLSSMLLLETE